jgi:hypothetical protein
VARPMSQGRRSVEGGVVLLGLGIQLVSCFS